jgi:dimethylamine/trimethylamine dehydrogenase
MDPRHACLFEPIEIGPKTMKNRFYAVPHCAGFGAEKPLAQALFRGMKAVGGWGTICTEYTGISPEADDTYRVNARLWDEDDVAGLSLTVDAIHRAGALAGAELWHGGVHTPNMESRSVTRGPTQIASEVEYTVTCKEMDLDDIRQVQQQYVDAAVRARDAGYDIVYVYGGHGQGPGQFLMPYYNKRTDNYGGSFENRARMWREIIEKVRVTVGDDCAIAVRISADSLMGDEGIVLERDCLPFVELVDDMVDLWDVVIGGYEWGEDATPSRYYPSGRHLPWQSAVKAVTKKPVVGVGRFTDPDLMAKVINSGKLDIIGAARPSIADPYLPAKIHEGRLEDIRECIGCNACIARWEIGGPPLVCTQNATAGEEYRRGWHPELFSRARNADRDVLVIGAGPAGMECARVLGERQMNRVHLVDANTEPGGNVSWVSRLPGLGEWARVINYRKIQVEKLPNVEFIPRRRLTAQEAAEYGAEIVIVATGASWSPTGLNPVTRANIPGANAELPWVLTPEQIMLDAKPVPGLTAVIIDMDGYHIGSGLAQRLVEEGKQVTVVTHLAEVGPYMHNTLELPNMHRFFHKSGVQTVTSSIVHRVEEGAAWISQVYDAAEHQHPLDADAVVLVTQRRSNDALYHGLKSEIGEEALRQEGVEAVYRIGDCVAPRIIAECVFDGHRIAREIDSDNPETPLPFKRDRRVAARNPAMPEDLDLTLEILGAPASTV